MDNIRNIVLVSIVGEFNKYSPLKFELKRVYRPSKTNYLKNTCSMTPSFNAGNPIYSSLLRSCSDVSDLNELWHGVASNRAPALWVVTKRYLGQGGFSVILLCHLTSVSGESQSKGCHFEWKGWSRYWTGNIMNIKIKSTIRQPVSVKHTMERDDKILIFICISVFWPRWFWMRQCNYFQQGFYSISWFIDIFRRLCLVSNY